MRTIILVSLAVLFGCGVAVAQQQRNTVPEIGKPLPPFYLTTITHYKKTEAGRDDFKGKWLILDLWASNCSACINKFPTINEWQREFKDEIQFLVIGKNDKKYNSGIERLYEKLRVKMNLDLPSAYDSVLFERWDIPAVPSIFVVDPDGIVRGITGGQDMTTEKLRKLVNGQPVSFYNEEAMYQSYLDKRKNKTDRREMLYESYVTRWSEGDHPNFTASINISLGIKGAPAIKINRASLASMYLFAYTGYKFLASPPDSGRKRELYETFYPVPLLLTRDSSIFDSDYTSGKNCFNYKLNLDYSSLDTAQVLQILRQDLERTFGFKASVEVRPMPVWKLVAQPGAEEKLKTKGGEFWHSAEGSSGGPAGFSIKNVSVRRFLNMAVTYCKDYDIPYLDETGISGNIDITFDALLTDLDQVVAELRKNGLDLVRGKKKMRVIVIRD